jgi:hypothetical protein
MEFDPGVHTRWKVSLYCFAVVVGIIAFGAIVPGANWAKMHWVIALFPSVCGAALALFSILANESHRWIACVSLALNLIVPGLFLWAILR